MVELADRYFEAVNRPAEELFDYRVQGENGATLDPVFLRDNKTNEAIGWVIPNIFTADECEKHIEMAENHGMEPPAKLSLRSAKRTVQLYDKELSDLVYSRIKEALDEHHEDPRPAYGIHSNWRIPRYDAGDAFPAHTDQSDNMQIKNEEDGTKELIVSSHTLLIQLSRDGVQGGATRFYPRRNNEDINTIYDYAVDVHLPRGWGLVFRQKGLVHAGQPILAGNDGVAQSKYVAQAGVLRVVPIGMKHVPSVFKNGPGLQEYLDENFDKLSAKAGEPEFYARDDRPSMLPPHLA